MMRFYSDVLYEICRTMDKSRKYQIRGIQTHKYKIFMFSLTCGFRLSMFVYMKISGVGVGILFERKGISGVENWVGRHCAARE